MPIQFHTEEPLIFELKQSANIMQWLQNVIKEEKHFLADLNYIFCTDDYLLNINRQYLQHDYYTDVITFDNSDQGPQIEGDIFISIDRIQENAASLSVDTQQELQRVMVHGLLHLLGYKDKSEADQKIMRQKEDHYLAVYS